MLAYCFFRFFALSAFLFWYITIFRYCLLVHVVIVTSHFFLFVVVVVCVCVFVVVVGCYLLFLFVFVLSFLLKRRTKTHKDTDNFHSSMNP
jgi:hypothetical protein